MVRGFDIGPDPWAAALVGVGLAITMLLYNAVLTAIGFEGGLLLGFIGLVSVIAFGVDFFVHAAGRAREQQVAGLSRDRSYPRGLTLVFTALLLAVASSAAAFISNGVAGIQAIVQFGIGTAIALLIGFVVLGIIVPRWLLGIEDMVGEQPLERGLMLPYKLGFIVMLCALLAAIAMRSIKYGLAAVVLILLVVGWVYGFMWWASRVATGPTERVVGRDPQPHRRRTPTLPRPDRHRTRRVRPPRPQNLAGRTRRQTLIPASRRCARSERTREALSMASVNRSVNRMREALAHVDGVVVPTGRGKWVGHPARIRSFIVMMIGRVGARHSADATRLISLLVTPFG